MPHTRSASSSSCSNQTSSSNTSHLRRKLRHAINKQRGGTLVPEAEVRHGEAKTAKAAKASRRNDAQQTAAKTQVDEIENLREMLVDKQQELTQENNADRKKDIEKDVEILKQWLRDKEEKAGKAGKQLASLPKVKKDAGGGPHTNSTKAKINKPDKPSKKEGGIEKVLKSATKTKTSKQTSKAEKLPAQQAEAKESTKAAQQAEAKESKKASTLESVAKSGEVEAQNQADKKRLLSNADSILQAKETLQQSVERQKAEAPLPALHAEAAPVAPAEPVELAPSAPPKQERPRAFVLASEVTTLMPSEKAPPCELPLWCVMPNPRDVEVVLEIVRHVPGSNVPSKRMRLGRRAWALLGRRLHEAQAAEARRAGVPEPDIGLACPLSSKAHAIVLQNWTGKIFLKDLGSAHGTFLDRARLNPHEPIEWQAGSQAYFADASTEFFELRAA